MLRLGDFVQLNKASCDTCEAERATVQELEAQVLPLLAPSKRRKKFKAGRQRIPRGDAPCLSWTTSYNLALAALALHEKTDDPKFRGT